LHDVGTPPVGSIQTQGDGTISCCIISSTTPAALSQKPGAPRTPGFISSLVERPTISMSFSTTSPLLPGGGSVPIGRMRGKTNNPPTGDGGWEPTIHPPGTGFAYLEIPDGINTSWSAILRD